MKLAIACDDTMQATHFGHCAYYIVIDTDHLENQRTIKHPGHQPGVLPKFLKDLSIDTLITNRIGAKAIALFNHYGIAVITGAEGTASELAQAYHQGDLSSTNAVCHDHEHADHCHNH